MTVVKGGELEGHACTSVCRRSRSAGSALAANSLPTAGLAEAVMHLCSHVFAKDSVRFHIMRLMALTQTRKHSHCHAGGLWRQLGQKKLGQLLLRLGALRGRPFSRKAASRLA